MPDPRSLMPSPWLSWGQCIEHYGASEAYLPILEALGRLCRTTGGERLVPLLRQYAPSWLAQLPALVPEADYPALQQKVAGTTRERMLREMAEALEAGSAERPVVLVLEDLHWSDVSTLDLLNTLARRRGPARLLLLATYRPTEVIVHDHPLRAVKQELVTRGLAVEVPLSYLRVEAVQMYVTQQAGTLTDSAPELGALIYKRTEGQPLFMVQLTAELVQRGTTLPETWNLLPPGLQQLVAAQIERLTPAEQAVLEAGSVAGAEFSVASVAAGVERPLTEIETCCEQLAQQGQFITEQEFMRWPDGTVSGRYGFRHALYQEVLYQRLSGNRRARLHLAIGLQEEAAYGARAREFAAELAVHFERSKDTQRAVRYFQQAGENASRRNASREAVMLLVRALDLLHTWPDTPERAHQELRLQLALGRPLMLHKGYAAPEVEHAYTRALELCGADEPLGLRLSVLSSLTYFWIARGEFVRAQDLAEQCLDLTRQTASLSHQLQVQSMLGMICYYLGEPVRAREYLAPGITFSETHVSGSDMVAGGVELAVSCLSYTAVALWSLGYPEQASKRSAEALSLARQVERPGLLASALHVAAWIYRDRRETPAAHVQVETLMELCREYELPFWFAWGQTTQGWVLTEQGYIEEGIRHVHRSLDGLQTVGAEGGLSDTLALLAEAYSKLGQPEAGFALLTQALNCVAEKGERYYEAEIYRLKGELLLSQKEKKQKSEGGKKLDTKPESKTFVPFTM